MPSNQASDLGLVGLTLFGYVVEAPFNAFELEEPPVYPDGDRLFRPLESLHGLLIWSDLGGTERRLAGPIGPFSIGRSGLTYTGTGKANRSPGSGGTGKRVWRKLRPAPLCLARLEIVPARLRGL